MLPRARALADLFGEFALGGVERTLALLVELAGRQLQKGGLVHRLARLPHEVGPLAVVGDDPDRAGVLHDLALGLLAVVVAEAVDPLHQSSSVVWAASSAACLTSETVTSSIVSSASSVTDSSGW